MTTDLSRVPGMFVIARGAAYTNQGKPLDARRIGKRLGVRYVLEGSVRKIGGARRVNTQLIATETGAHLWADRFDQKLSDLSAEQEEIVYRIGRTLNVALADIDIARSKRDRSTNPDAFDLVLRARSLFSTSNEFIGARGVHRLTRACPSARSELYLCDDPTCLPVYVGTSDQKR